MANPDLQVTRGGGHPDPEIKGGGGGLQKYFFRPSKNKGGPGQRTPPLDPPLNISIILKLKGRIKERLISRFLNVLKNLLSGLKINLLRLDLGGIGPKKTVSSHLNPFEYMQIFWQKLNDIFIV